jgi:orotidine-5'-phosphate decarboxylase
MSFINNLRARWSSAGMVCVGLDPDPAKLPDCLKASNDAIFEFNKAIIDATHDIVCCYKPQAAYYAAADADDALRRTIAYIHDNYPGIPVILDVKRGDIGATARMYAVEAFDRYGADAVTVNPYMGTDALDPFIDRNDRGVVILCRTSNPGVSALQNLVADGKTIYEHVAVLAATRWNRNGNVLLVAGATYPEELGKIRKLIGDMPLLVPGVGAQGGSVEAVIANGLDSSGYGLVINSSRGIIYASKGDDFAEKAREATQELNRTIEAARKAAER